MTVNKRVLNNVYFSPFKEKSALQMQKIKGWVTNIWALPLKVLSLKRFLFSRVVTLAIWNSKNRCLKKVVFDNRQNYNFLFLHFFYIFFCTLTYVSVLCAEKNMHCFIHWAEQSWHCYIPCLEPIFSVPNIKSIAPFSRDIVLGEKIIVSP